MDLRSTDGKTLEKHVVAFDVKLRPAETATTTTATVKPSLIAPGITPGEAQRMGIHGTPTPEVPKQEAPKIETPMESSPTTSVPKAEAVKAAPKSSVPWEMQLLEKTLGDEQGTDAATETVERIMRGDDKETPV
jgi:hypothetical protein